MATTKSTGFKLSVMTLAIMNITAVVSLRGLPAEAVYGPSSAFYYLFAALVFLIPTALVAAELAAMFADKQGGVFRWVGEAMGARTGFLAIWLQWIESTIWYPTVLTFGAVSIAFIGMHPTADMALASNKMYTLIVVLVIYWAATFIALKGLGWVGKVAKIGGLVGTIIPAGLLIVLGIIYLSTGGHNNMDMSQGFFPDLTKFDNLVLASGIFLFYAGMEMMGIHVMDVKNPSKNISKIERIGDYRADFRTGYFFAGLHYSRKGYQPDAEPADRFRQLFPLPAYELGLPDHRHCPDVRCAGRRADMGGRSFERYLYRG